MDIFFCVFYVIGVFLTFFYLERMRKEYNTKHKDEIEKQTKEDKQYVDKMMIVTSIFSWFALITLILAQFAHTNEKD